MKRHQLLFLILSLLALTCKKEPPPAVHIPTLTLTAVDASCTEAWLKLTTTQVPATVRLVRLTPTLQTLQTLQLTTPDTLLIDEGLLPRRTYTYKAYTLEVRGSGFQVVDSSTQATVTTMDTTSHNFTWQIDTLGDGGGSVLYDVAIINDTLAYAVGEIYKRDSVGNWDPQPYGLAIWNGRFWSLRKIMVVSQQGDTHSRVLRGVYAFSATDVWFGDGNAFHWDGQSTFATAYWISGYPGNPTPVLGPNQGVHKFWGTSGSNLYGVGVNGGIAHYDGVRWRRIESGTTLPIKDIYGAREPESGQYEVLCVSADQALPGHSQILKIENMTVREVATHPEWEPWGIWFVPGRRYLHAGDGLWEARTLSGPWVRNNSLPAWFKSSVRGQSLSDIVVSGSFWLLSHNNGVTWQTYFPRTSGAFGGINIKRNLLVSVGFIGDRAVVIQGRRN